MSAKGVAAMGVLAALIASSAANIGFAYTEESCSAGGISPAPYIDFNDSNITNGIQMYCGVVTDKQYNESNSISKILLSSEKYGEIAINIYNNTICIDYNTKDKSDIATVDVGETMFVFHSSYGTKSMPPIYKAFAIVRNTPQDTKTAMMHTVSAVKDYDSYKMVYVNDGKTAIHIDNNTSISNYLDSEDGTGIVTGDRIMVWPGETYSKYGIQIVEPLHIMLLHMVGEDAGVKREDIVAQLYDMYGSPDVIEYNQLYADVNESLDEYNAIMWATNAGLVAGYGNGEFGYNDMVTREQLVTILWRMAGKPKVTDKTNLEAFMDINAISDYASEAMSWAVDNKYIWQHTSASYNECIIAPLAAVDTQYLRDIIERIESELIKND